VVGTEALTTVTITPSVTVAYQIGSGPVQRRVAGVPYTVVVGQGEVYQLLSYGEFDLTGTLVKADKPVAVFGGNRCANVPTDLLGCDYLVEQLAPIRSWGSAFVVVPLATRGGDTIRVVAAEDDTVISVNGAVVSTLNAGQFYSSIRSGLTSVASSKPVLVAQFSHGFNSDQVPGGPSMVMVAPSERYQRSYTLVTPPGFANNFINVVVPTASIGQVSLDGSLLDPTVFSTIGSVSIGLSSFSGAQIHVEPGIHRVRALVPIAATFYGFDSLSVPPCRLRPDRLSRRTVTVLALRTLVIRCRCGRGT
jgi:IgGFc binding protein